MANSLYEKLSYWAWVLFNVAILLSVNLRVAKTSRRIRIELWSSFYWTIHAIRLYFRGEMHRQFREVIMDSPEKYRRPLPAHAEKARSNWLARRFREAIVDEIDEKDNQLFSFSGYVGGTRNGE